MQKEKKIRTYTRKTKTGKTVTVKAHTAKYDAAEEARKAFAAKRGAGEELSEVKTEKVAPAANDDLGFSAEDYKAWYHWDTEGDPKNASALKVKKALIAKMGRSAYNKYEKQMTDSYSARGHLKGFKGLGDSQSKESLKVEKPTKVKETKKASAPKNADATKKSSSAKALGGGKVTKKESSAKPKVDYNAFAEKKLKKYKSWKVSKQGSGYVLTNPNSDPYRSPETLRVNPAFATSLMEYQKGNKAVIKSYAATLKKEDKK